MEEGSCAKPKYYPRMKVDGNGVVRWVVCAKQIGEYSNKYLGELGEIPLNMFDFQTDAQDILHNNIEKLTVDNPEFFEKEDEKGKQTVIVTFDFAIVCEHPFGDNNQAPKFLDSSTS